MNAVFEQPPDRREGRPRGVPNGIWVDRLEPLRAHEGRWARVHETQTWRQAIEAARNIRTGRVLTPPGTFETKAAKKDGRFFVYARFMG
jgi:hypothetical protein